MSAAALLTDTREIVVDEVMPHAAEVVWKTLTTPELMGRWLMVPTGFEARCGNRFTYQTTPAGPWDGVIRCEVLEAVAGERLVYSWQGGHEANAGYGSRLETVVTWTIAPVDGGVRVRLVHSGFRPAKNDAAYEKMSQGWPKVVEQVGVIAAEGAAPRA